MSGGISKKHINQLVAAVDSAFHFGRDICVLGSADLVVHMQGDGVGGKNTEAAAASALHMSRLPGNNGDDEGPLLENDFCILWGDSIGVDGNTLVAGAIVDRELIESMAESNVDIEKSIAQNDTYTSLNALNEGNNMVRAQLTATDIMDMFIITVQKPREKKYLQE